MPNLCLNKIVIEGDPDDLSSLRDRVRSEKLAIDFDTVLPAPRDEDDEIDWTWTAKHWGCVPPEAEDMKIVEADGRLVYEFVSIKGDPSQAVSKLSELYPSLTITHEFDHEYDFKGGVVYQGGEAVDVLPIEEF